MHIVRKILFFLLLASTIGVHAANHILIMGAGGEPQEYSDTIFDASFENLSSYLLKSKTPWALEISYDGGHTLSEAMVASHFSAYLPKHFTKHQFEAQIDSYKSQIQNGTLKSGDQLMVTILTHGNNKEVNEKTHSIQTIDGEISLDKLEELQQLAVKKNIKLAILDFSCHSGQTMKLRDDNTCIITAASPNNFGQVDFSEEFMIQMGKNENLEETFLKTRKNCKSMTLPMINSPVGNFIQGDELSIEHNLFWNDVSDYKVDTFVQNSCSPYSTSPEFLGLLQLAEKLSPTKENFKALRESLDAYNKELNLYKENFSKKKACEEQVEVFQSGQERSVVSYNELIMVDSEDIANHYAQTNERDRENIFRQITQRKRELERSNKIYQDCVKTDKALDRQHKKFTKLAEDVAKNEKKFYDSLYRSLQKKDGFQKRKNPCRDFRL